MADQFSIEELTMLKKKNDLFIKIKFEEVRKNYKMVEKLTARNASRTRSPIYAWHILKILDNAKLENVMDQLLFRLPNSLEFLFLEYRMAIWGMWEPSSPHSLS